MKAVVILIGLLFWLEGIILLDPDFGWHLKMGNLILEKGIPKTDPFSYTMPDFPFVDHEWLTNIVIAKLYPLIGLKGLATVAALFTLAALLISIPSKFKRWAFIPFLLSSATIFTFTGVRPQIQTWLFLAVLFKVTLDKKLWLRWRFFVPILFILWANLHGGFASGIVVIVVILATQVIKTKKVDITDLFVLLSSIAATLINPYGPRLWGEVWMQISDGSLRFWIAEWIPILFSVNLAFCALLALSMLLILHYRKKIGLTKLVLYFGLLLAGLSSSRHVPLWLMITLPLVLNCLEWFYQDIKKIPLAAKRFNLVYKTALILTIFVFFFNIYYTLKSSFSLNQTYPNKAISYLKSNLPKGQIFALYGWGGYLIWNLPEKKVFIDGRMPSWHWSTPNNSNGAFEEYKKVFYFAQSYQQIFDKYNINTVFLEVPKAEQTNELLKIFNFSIFKTASRKSLLEHLKEDGWKQIYIDEVAVIYQK